MNKILYTVFCVVALCCSGVAYGDSIRVGITQDEPVSFVDEEGRAQGFIPDLIREISRKQKNWVPEFISVTQGDGIRLLESGAIDLFVSGNYTEPKFDVLDYNQEAILEFWGQLYVRSGSDFKRIHDLQRNEVGVVRGDVNGTNFAKLTDLLGVNCTFHEYDSYDEIFKAIDSGVVKAGVVPNVWGFRRANSCGVVGTSVLFSPLKGYCSTKKGNFADLLAEFDEVLREWKLDGNSYYYERLYFWLTPAEDGIGKPHWGYVIFLAGALLCILLLLGVSWLLMRLVHQRTKALKDGEERLREAHRIAKIGRWDVYFETGMVVWSDELQEIFGIEKRITPKDREFFYQYIFPEDRERIDQVFYEAIERHEPYELEHRLVTSNGEIKWVLELGECEYDTAGRPVHAFGTTQDITERKHAELANNKSSERLSLATQAAGVGIWEYDFARDELIFDDLMNVLLDVCPDSFGGQMAAWDELIHPDDVVAVKEHFSRAVRCGELYQDAYRIIWTNGSVHHIRVQAEIRLAGNGKPLRCVGTCWDVTIRRKMVAALKSREQDYRQLFENMTTGLVMLEVVYDGEGLPGGYRVLQVNKAAEEMLERDRIDVIDQEVADIFHPLEAGWIEVFDRVAITGESSAFEKRLRVVDKLFYIWVFSAKPGHLGVILSDITARRMAEDAASRVQQQLQHFVENTKDIIFQTDLTGMCTYMSPAAEEILGFTIPEMLTKNVVKLSAPEYRDFIRRRIQLRIDGRIEEGMYSFEVIHKKGHRVWLELMTNGVVDSTGELVGIQGVARDITERKFAERKLEESQRFLQTAFDLLPVGIFWKDLDLKYLGANRTLLNDFGFESEDDVIGQDDSTVFPGCSIDDVHRKDELRVIELGESKLNHEEVHVSPEGEQVTLLMSKVPSVNVDGEIVGMLGVYIDITQVKALEADRRNVQGQLQHIVDNSNDVVFQIDASGNYIFTNSAIVRLTGYSESEILKMNVSQIVHPNYHEEMKQRSYARMNGEVISEGFQFEVIKRDGSTRWGEVVSKEVLGVAGEYQGVQGVVRDITERKVAEIELKESRMLLRTIIDTIPARVFWKDLSSTYMGCNLAFAKDTGIDDPSKIIGLSDLDMSWSESEREMFRADDRAVMTSGIARVNFEETQTRADGTRFWLSTSKVPIRNAEGGVIGVLGAYEDITARKSFEEERILLSAAVDQADEAIVIMDPDRLVLYVNSAFETITGMPRPEVVGHVFPAFLLGGSASFYTAWSVVETGKSWNGRVHGRSADDTQCIVDITVSPVNDAAQIVNYIATIRDVKGQVELEKNMRQAQKMDAVGRLAGGVAHDFNNILQSILGFCGMLMQDLSEGTMQYDDVNEIRKAAGRAGTLTRQLLMLGRKQRVEYSSHSLNEIIRGNEKMMRRLIGENIQFDFNLAEGLKAIRADAGQVEQIILNLFINARDAMPKGGTVRVGTEMTTKEDETQESGKQEFVCLSVMDTGCGIRDDVRQHLFEPFFTTKNVGEGTGLGLSVVYGIVQQHGGSIEVQSEVGQGAEFKVYLPVCSGEMKSPVEASFISPEGRGELILVLEDDDTLRALSSRILKNAGYLVVSAHNLESARQMLKESSEEFKLVLSDVVLPDGNGVDFALESRKEIMDVPVLLCSGYIQNPDAYEIIRDNQFRFLEKPVPTMLLLQTVREMLDERVR